MQLRTARLCLNCEEIHDARECPLCGSESFAYITRWVPAPEPREMPRPLPPNDAETYRQLLAPEPVQPWGMRWVRRGALGLIAVSVGRWVWQRAGEPSPRTESPAYGPAPEADSRAPETVSHDQTGGRNRRSS